LEEKFQYGQKEKIATLELLSEGTKPGSWSNYPTFLIGKVGFLTTPDISFQKLSNKAVTL
jgi:hypothetical protein